MPSKRQITLIISLTIALLSYFGFKTDVFSFLNSSQGSDGFYDIVKVVDGDTIKVQMGDKVETIRMIGVNTPESVDPRKPVECFGKEASAKAKEFLQNKKVKLENDSTQGERDKYQRLLRYVFLEDGTFYNKWIIEQGYAHEYTYDFPYKYQLEFKAAEKTAREAKIGLWADNACQNTEKK